MSTLLSEGEEDTPTQITRFGKERVKQYCILFPPSLVEEIDAKRGLVDRSTWIRDKLKKFLIMAEYESKSGFGGKNVRRE